MARWCFAALSGSIHLTVIAHSIYVSSVRDLVHRGIAKCKKVQSLPYMQDLGASISWPARVSGASPRPHQPSFEPFPALPAYVRESSAVGRAWSPRAQQSCSSQKSGLWVVACRSRIKVLSFPRDLRLHPGCTNVASVSATNVTPNICPQEDFSRVEARAATEAIWSRVLDVVGSARMLRRKRPSCTNH